ncbi:hypothetical protein N0V88_003324 [Collariella sp. IMI 366227]|nr:hypothetical protein N0V88_003324 [Collariella sp. IMI 366227]
MPYGYPAPAGQWQPGADPRAVARTRKDIKRRTKTGCKTCRHRRIKCDEGQPTCGNCAKSRRDCAGYDPVFRQHRQGSTAIQPAPKAWAAAAPAPAPAAPAPAVHAQYQAAYQPPPVPSNASTASQTIKTEPAYDYSAAIDPALQAADPTVASGSRPSRYQQSNPAAPVNQSNGDSGDSRATKLNVDGLIAAGGRPPHPPASPPSADRLDSIMELYSGIYIPALVAFFETRWYDVANHQAAVLSSNNAPISYLSSLIEMIESVDGTNPADVARSTHLESYVVWSIARLPLSATATQRQHYADAIPAEDDLWEARGRLQVLEALISGETLEINPLAPPPAANLALPRAKELKFWHTLGSYLLQQHASSSPDSVWVRDRCLGTMQNLSGSHEGRDLLYSIVCLREYMPRWGAATEQEVALQLGERGPCPRLAAATRFVREQSTNAGLVVRRFAELAYRAFVRPGYNVDRIG